MDSFYLIPLFTILGIFSAFLSSLLSSVSYDEISIINKSYPKSINKLQKIRANFDEDANAYFIMELLFYFIAAIEAGAYINDALNQWYNYIYAVLALFSTVVLLRSLFASVGRRFSGRMIRRFSIYLTLLHYIALPAVALIKLINKTITGAEEDDSREELDAIVESAREEGSIDSGEYRILKNIIHFREVLVSDVMTPHTVVFSCEAKKTVGDVVNLPELKMYSRFPVWEGESLDDGVMGYVMTRDVLHAALLGQMNKKLSDISREVYFIPENAELEKGLDMFLRRREHLFLVVDEYGGIEGLLTMEDVLETILGVEIVDEADKVVDLRELASQHRDARIASIQEKSTANGINFESE